MVLLLTTLLASLATVVVAAPANDLFSRTSCKAFLDTYEEYGTILVPQAVRVGQYHGVTYQGFGVGSKGAVSGTNLGLVPHGGMNTAAASINSALTDIGAVTLNAFGTINASPSQSFDLTSFWFGCGLQNGNPQLPGVATGCTIGVTGYTKDNKVVPLASFNFAPRSVTSAQMQLAALPSTFKNLKSVTIGVATGALLTPGTLLVIDDLSHCNY